MAKGRSSRGVDPLDVPGAELAAEVIDASDGIAGVRLTVLVRATYRTDRYVRVAQAKLENAAAAREFVRGLHARKKDGLDPLAGMEPVENYGVGAGGKCRAAAPHFVARSAG